MTDYFNRRGWAMRRMVPGATPSLVEEEINPSSGWFQQPEFHYLLVDLPGFKKEDIKVNVEESVRRIVFSGRSRIGEEKQVHYFQKSFNVPEDGDIKRISMIFEQETLRVSIPKLAREMKEEPKKTNSSDTKRSTNDSKEKEKEKEKTEIPASASSSHPKEEAEEGKKDKTEENPTFASSSHPKEEAEEEQKDETEESSASASSSYPKEEAEEEKKDETVKSPASASSNRLKEEIEEEKKDETEKSPASASSSQPKEETEEKKKDETEGPAEEPQSKNQLIVKISEYKGILIASIISFTLGVLLSQKFHPLPPK